MEPQKTTTEDQSVDTLIAELESCEQAISNIEVEHLFTTTPKFVHGDVVFCNAGTYAPPSMSSAAPVREIDHNAKGKGWKLTSESKKVSQAELDGRGGDICYRPDDYVADNPMHRRVRRYSDNRHLDPMNMLVRMPRHGADVDRM
mmetsp:Transcript_33973/g.64914  ORF Transcript_33973/g.64914 Transcript_33973/m.64914 type:complete len:145 (+) Transcript_33973:310-744(+)